VYTERIKGVSLDEKITDDAPTLIAIGALVSIVASLAHEALGHGVGCAIDHGQIALITFLVFRCDGTGASVDGGGPMGSLVVGCAAVIITWVANPRSPTVKLFLFTLSVLALLWFWAQMIRDSIARSDDWGSVAADLHWPTELRLLACSVGLVGYIATLRIVGRGAYPLAGGRPGRLLIPYLAATLSAVSLGALWHGDRIGSALDGLLTFGVAPFGYLLVIRRTAQSSPVQGAIARNFPLLGSVVVIWVAFALTVARGIGRLS
jgi:hypothetical protein